jgi:hypothetical protein
MTGGEWGGWGLLVITLLSHFINGPQARSSTSQCISVFWLILTESAHALLPVCRSLVSSCKWTFCNADDTPSRQDVGGWRLVGLHWSAGVGAPVMFRTVMVVNDEEMIQRSRVHKWWYLCFTHSLCFRNVMFILLFTQIVLDTITTTIRVTKVIRYKVEYI